MTSSTTLVVEESPPRSIVSREFGFVFQFFDLIANLDVADNIELPMLLGGRSSLESRHRRHELSAISASPGWPGRRGRILLEANSIV